MNATIKSEVVAVALVLMTKDAIKADQDTIRGNLLSLDQLVHKNAVQCLLHAEKHGDTSLMRRLLVETLGGKNGYRVRGLINWMRLFSPMELKSDGTINLTGTDAKGVKRPFNVTDANNTPFWNDPRNDERVAKPVFQDTLMSPFNRATKAITEAVENTVDGKPVDATKPYFDGVHSAALVAFADKVKMMVAELKPDDTIIVRRARAQRDEADAIIKASETKAA